MIEGTPEESTVAAERGSLLHDMPQARKPASRVPWVILWAMIAILLLALLVGMRISSGVARPMPDDSQVKAIQAELSASESELNALRVSMGLRPKESAFEPVGDVAARLKKDADTMVALAKSLQSSLVEKEAMLSAKNAEIIKSDQTRLLLVGELEKLKQQLGSSIASSAIAESVRSENDALKAQRDALVADLARVRDELAAQRATANVPSDEIVQWERRLEEATRARQFLETRVGQLEQELSKAKLFAKSENDLLPAAVQLFRSLRKLENKSDSEITAEYANLGVELGASVMHVMSFETGSSAMAAADDARIRAIVSEVPDGDLVLFVGYASETGNVDGNRELSSARATTAAELYTNIKRPGQKVQAVYLGQTDRFSSRIPERNQLVEIWRIRIK
jgi:flagellar motor protein MotB